MEKIKTTEEQHPEKEWFKEAEEQNIGTLETFIERVITGYEHDYGTICHAVAACAIAAAYAADRLSGGITAFQAGFVMWDFIRQWCYSSNKCGMKIVDYDNMLYPQFADKFEKTINRDTWEIIQKEARMKLSEELYASYAVIDHWRSIVYGKVPFGYTVKDD